MAFNEIKVSNPIVEMDEVGVTPSKLSLKTKYGGLKFYPERYVSRQDLIEWRSQLVYGLELLPPLEIKRWMLDVVELGELGASPTVAD
ncbi:Cytosolic isocitrate dehydrogenase [NADP] [Bienertia sinuspersici]